MQEHFWSSSNFELNDDFASLFIQVLIETLLRSRSGTVEGLTLAIDLCQAFEVFKADVWSQILVKLVSLHQWDHLLAALDALEAMPQLWSLPSYLDAWSLLLERPFKNANKPLNVDQRQECEKALGLLMKCPVPQNLASFPFIKMTCEELDIGELFSNELAVLK